MSAAQLEAVIKEVQDVFGAWTAETTLPQMRQDWDEIFSRNPVDNGASSEPLSLGGVPAVRFSAPGAATDRAVLYLHGGGYAFGSPRSHADIGKLLSQTAQAQVYVLDYRLAPEHPFPAAVDDALAAYRALLASGYTPARIAISGDSAGGGLTLATLLAIRDGGLPRPACAVPLSPWADMVCDGETYVSRAAVDPIVQQGMILQLAGMYLGGADPLQPLASPMRGDLSGLPPLLIQVGDRETLLDDSRRVAERARQAGVDVRLEIEAGQIHVFQIFARQLDEGMAAIERMGAFIREHTGG